MNLKIGILFSIQYKFNSKNGVHNSAGVNIARVGDKSERNPLTTKNDIFI